MGPALVERSAPGEVVRSLSRLRPLLDCSSRRFDAATGLLEELASLVQQPRAAAEWLRRVEQLLAAHGVDSRPALQEARTLARCSGWSSTPGESTLRDLARLRCSDARLLVRVLCEAVGCARRGLVLHLLEPLLVLRRIRDDAREHARGGERFNLVTEHVQLFGAERASLQLCLEQNQLVRTLSSRWQRLPRGEALAFWPVVFEGAEPTAPLAWLPTAALVRRARRRLSAAGFSPARREEGARREEDGEPQREIARAVPGQDRKAPSAVEFGVAGSQHRAAVVALRQRIGEQLGCASDDWACAGVDIATRIDLAAGQLHVLTAGPDVLASIVCERRGCPDVWTSAQREEFAVYVNGLVVDQNRSGPLIGRVVDHLRSWAAARGIRWIRAELPSEHSGLRQYYRRLGFEQIRAMRREGGTVLLLQLPVRGSP